MGEHGWEALLAGMAAQQCPPALPLHVSDLLMMKLQMDSDVIWI